jgi:long-chain acyl-CoA synthetase
MREFTLPALVEIPATATLTDVVFDTAAKTPEVVVLRRREAEGNWSDVTAARFCDEIRALAKGLIASGVGPGDRVGLMSRTSYAWTVIDYAIWAIGAVTVPVYETSSREQVEWILSDSGAIAVFTETAAHAATIADVRSALSDLADVWPIETAVADITAAGAQVSDEQFGLRLGTRTADDLATIVYTSGTTGRPKGCELTHRNLLSGARNAVHGALTEIFDIPGSSTLLFLPLAHSFARIIEVGCIEAGVTLMHWPDSSTVAKGLSQTSPTFLLAVPRVFEKVFNSARQQACESGVKSKIFAAAADTARRLRPAGVQQAQGGGRRPGALRGIGRSAAWRPARSLLPRCRDHRARGLRAHRDLGGHVREPAKSQPDRYRWPAAARRERANRRRRRDPHLRPDRVPRLLAQSERDR